LPFFYRDAGAHLNRDSAYSAAHTPRARSAVTHSTARPACSSSFLRMKTDWICVESNSNSTFLLHCKSNTDTDMNLDIFEYECKTNASGSNSNSDIDMIYELTYCTSAPL